MGRSAGVRWAVQAAAAVGWAFTAMAGTAALGLHLLGADGYARLGPMTAAVVALGAGGSVTPVGSAGVFGAGGVAGAHTALDVMPLGVALVGAAVLGRLFVQPLRRRAEVPPRELAYRAAVTVVCFLAVLGLLCWAGDDTTTLDVGKLTGAGGGSGGGDDGGLGGLLDPGKLGGIVGGIAKPTATVGYSVRTGPTLLAGLLWVLAVLVLALAVSRRTPLPRGWEALDRTVRPVASALGTVLLVAVVAGVGTAVVLPLTEGSSPATAAGGALLATPNGIGLAVPVALGTTLTGQATGALAHVVPAPLDRLLSAGTAQDVTLGRLRELDGSLWVLPVAIGLLLLLAGVLAAVRTPVAGPVPGGRGPGGPVGERPSPAPLREAAAAALRLGLGLAVAVPAGLALSEVSVDASLSVLGFDAFGAKASLGGSLPLAALYGLVWGAVAGFAGWLLVDRFAAARRPAAAPGAATAPGGGQAGGGQASGGRAVPPAGPVPQAPVDGTAPGGSGGGGGTAAYGGLPEHRAPDAHPHNPYLADGGFNPYADGPTAAPPPPPHPPGRDPQG
ncbi:streptophobe family protein [Streptacidiphilus sp. ASG 303]|uniref:streptophobe family protein n=1 Tax=Streptacidiphilus sp. ASG 303 TaxID=2896847 RepID=UPI001E642B88|nr:streptophobe family protein [Streptacidiphilus sp. ASG 303]MCD0483262.1 streptophobe family protein [Streptacidiphilus sp. ASG 303]